MTRYQALRRAGFGALAAAFIAALNYFRDIPKGEIRFLTVTMEYDHDQVA